MAITTSKTLPLAGDPDCPSSTVAKPRMAMVQLYTVTAYLNTLIHRNKVYVRQPTGFAQGKSLVCMLLRAMYVQT
jgi:hypothetical protein